MSSPGPGLSAPRWVRLVRAGTRLTAYTSGDGAGWTTIGNETIALGTTAYVGVAVTSRQPSVRTTARASNVTITSTSAALPAGQASGDIGAPSIKGGASFASGRYSIKGAGAGIAAGSDQFHYVYQQVSGDLDVVARVTSLGAAAAWSKAGVMIRESLAANSPHALALVSAGNGYAFQRRSDPGGTTELTSGGSGVAPGWIRLVRTGSLIEAYRSATGSTWTKIGSDSVFMDGTVYVGIAVSSHDTGEATVAVVDSLRVTEKDPPANRPPLVTVTSPLSGQTFNSPATVAITATASDADGQIANVEFYANSTLLTRDSTAPYSHTISSLPAGDYAIKAVATDNQGAATISSTVSITVSAGASGLPRWVVFQASEDHSIVNKYVLEVYASGATPGVTSPLVTSDLGKPPVASNGEITVDRGSFFQALSPGSYIATVKAVGDGGSNRSLIAGFTR